MNEWDIGVWCWWPSLLLRTPLVNFCTRSEHAQSKSGRFESVSRTAHCISYRNIVYQTLDDVYMEYANHIRVIVYGMLESMEC